MAMTELIRALIKESVLELREDAYVDDMLRGIERQSDQQGIFNDRRAASQFAKQTLVRDIPELGGYQFVEYYPINGDKEKWMFDADTLGEYLNTVSIKHEIRGGASCWQFVFGRAVKSMERMTVEVIYKTPMMDDYEEFVQKVNADWQEWG